MIKLISAISIGILFSSCGLKVLKSFKATEPIVKPLKVAGKQVYLVNMQHLGKPLFYDNIKLIVDSFMRNDYIVYVESVAINKNGNMIIDTMAVKKLRKLLNKDLTINYTEMDEFRFFAKKHGLIFQPAYQYFFGSMDYKIVDINHKDLIQKYEDNYAEILLDSCDLRTSLGQSNYSCIPAEKEKRKIFEREIVFKARNEHVAQTIVHSSDKKILIMYGAAHYKGLKKELKKLKK